MACEEPPAPLEEIPERKPVQAQYRVAQADGAHERLHIARVVAAVVANTLVGRSPPGTPCRDAEHHPASRTNMLAPRPKSGLIVLDVLEHLEGADEVEQAPGRELLD